MKKSKNNINENKRINKRNLVLRENKKPSRPILMGIVALILVIGVVYFWNQPEKSTEKLPVAAAGVPGYQNPDEIVFPVSLFADGQARHFEYTEGAHTIRYFILKSADGVVRAAFDACDVCWPAGQGYYQAGDQMVCRNCKQKFASVKVNEVRGGCNPAPLKRVVDGDRLIIRVVDLAAGKKYFDFKVRG